jgi:hypothetical protein
MDTCLDQQETDNSFRLPAPCQRSDLHPRPVPASRPRAKVVDGMRLCASLTTPPWSDGGAKGGLLNPNRGTPCTTSIRKSLATLLKTHLHDLLESAPQSTELTLPAS